MLEEHVFEAKLGDQTLTLKTGKIARLAGGSVILQSGDTVLLATATMSPATALSTLSRFLPVRA